jgi:predicted molibdopterin-dependent oxidoreductase YjgC
MCDVGRQSYKALYHPQRLTQPLKKEGDQHIPGEYATLMTELAEKFRKLVTEYGPKQVGVMVKPSVTNEEAFLISRFCEQILETKNIDSQYEPEQEQYSDEILVHVDKNPNTFGCAAMELLPRGGGGMTMTDMLSAARLGSIRVLFIIDLDLFSRPSQEKGIISAFENIDLIILLQRLPNAMTDYAHYVVPITHWAEQNGTMTNNKGMVQKLVQVVDPPEGVRTPGEIIIDLARAWDIELPEVASEFVKKEVRLKLDRHQALPAHHGHKL